jgi:hypothetical protein
MSNIITVSKTLITEWCHRQLFDKHFLQSGSELVWWKVRLYKFVIRLNPKWRGDLHVHYKWLHIRQMRYSNPNF